MTKIDSFGLISGAFDALIASTSELPDDKAITKDDLVKMFKEAQEILDQTKNLASILEGLNG